MRTMTSMGMSFATIAVLMTGCANEPSRPYDTGAYDSRGTYENRGAYDNRGANDSRGDNRAAAYNQGVVDRIELVRKGDSNNIAGTIIGGIAGGLIGHQIGGGSGQTAATILGGVGGAVAGREVQNRTRGANEAFRVTVRMDNGRTEVVTQDDISDLRTGDRVRVDSNRIYRM